LAIVNGQYIYEPIAVAYINTRKLIKMGFTYEDVKKMKKTEKDYWLYINNCEERKIRQLNSLKRRR
jgi:hypothetical protein